MSEWNDLMRFKNMQGKFSTAILKSKTSTGEVFSLAGSVPIELMEERESGFCTIRVSKTWQSEQEVIDALLNIGITKFQLANCQWYGGKK